MGAFDWISSLIEKLALIFPRLLIIRSTMGVVKFKHGHTPIPLYPGLHIYWPIVSEIELFAVARQSDDLRSQSIVTKDGKTVIVGGMVIHKVVDYLKYVAECYDGPTTANEITMTAIHDVIAKLTWDDLLEGQRKGTLDTKLKNAAKDMLAEYGVEPIKVMLTDLAPVRVYKVIQSTSVDG